MMRALLIVGWLAAPLAALAFHLGPAQPLLKRDDAAQDARRADVDAREQEWEAAAEGYQRALSALPEGSRDRWPLEVSLGRAQLMSGDILEAQERLGAALQAADSQHPPATELAAQARYELATADYYAAWYLRLEGASADEWKPEAERARGHFRLLAESGDELRERSQHSLEATIRLEQMDLSELLARPLPKNCPKCKQGLCQRKRKQSLSRCQSPGNKPGEKKPDESARQSIKKSNSAGLNASDGTGS
jgi:hypothetical protein